MTLYIRHSLLIILSLIFIAASSCSKTNIPDASTIGFVTWKPNQPEVWDEIIRIFEKEHPDIKIKRQVGPHSSTEYHDLLTQKLKNKDDSVDVFFMDVIWPPEFAAAGWAEPLNNFFPSEEQKKFLPAPILANTYKGSIYGLPLFIDSGLLYFRKDLLKKYGFKPPKTWDELVEQAGIIVNGEKENNPQLWGYSGQFKQYEGLICDMLEFIMSNGGRLIDPDTGKSLIGEKKALDAVNFVRKKIIGKTAPVGVLNYQEPESLSLFTQGNAVFMRNWPYAWEVSNNTKRSKVAGKVGIARLPHFQGGKSFSTLGGWQLGISRYSKNKTRSWEFIKFLASPRIQKRLALKASLAPTRKALYNHKDILTVNPQFKDMQDVFLTAYPRPRSPYYPAISNVLQRYFSTALTHRQMSIKKLANDAEREIEGINKRFSLSKK